MQNPDKMAALVEGYSVLSHFLADHHLTHAVMSLLRQLWERPNNVCGRTCFFLG